MLIVVGIVRVVQRFVAGGWGRVLHGFGSIDRAAWAQQFSVSSNSTNRTWSSMFIYTVCSIFFSRTLLVDKQLAGCCLHRAASLATENVLALFA